MLHDTPTVDNTVDNTETEADKREAAHRRATTLLGFKADAEQKLKLAQWLLTGSTHLDPAHLLDPASLADAAEACFLLQDSDRFWNHASPAVQSEYTGRAVQIVTAYLSGGGTR